MDVLFSKAGPGLSTILRASLAIINRKDGAHCDLITFFDTVFTGMAGDRFFKSPDYVPWINISSDLAYTMVGDCAWHSCELMTPGNELVFVGGNLFGQYWISAAYGSAKNGRPSRDTIEFLERAVGESSESKRPLYLLMEASLALRDYDSTLKSFEKLVESGWPAMESSEEVCAYQAILVRIVDSYEKKGALHHAIRHFESLVRRFSLNSCYWVSLGLACSRYGDFAAAVHSLKQAATLNLEYIDLLTITCVENGSPQIAIDFCSAVVEKDVTADHCWRLLGDLYFDSREVETAVQLLSTGAKWNRKSVELYQRLTLAYHQLGNSDLALETCQRLWRLTKRRLDWIELGSICMRCEWYQMAIEAYEEGDELFAAGTASMAAGNYDTAILTFQELLDKKPWKTLVWISLWKCFKMKWDIGTARMVYENARRHHEGTSYFSNIPVRGKGNGEVSLPIDVVL